MEAVAMRDHTRLRAFKLADELVLETYKMTRTFPREELYGITSQMRRAALSVPSNIVEGCARESHREYLRFLEIAFGSLRELHYQTDLSKRLGYTSEDDFACWKKLLEETEKVLASLIRSFKNPLNP
jgi:four helix bundle protein